VFCAFSRSSFFTLWFDLRRTMRRFEGFMAKRTLLLDFQHDGIDWVLMRSGLRNAIIEKSGRLACHADAANVPDAMAALKGLRDSLDIPALACMAAVSGRGLFVRHITVPFHDKRKVRQILPLELEATLPVAVDEVSLDFQIIGQNATPAAVAVAQPKTQIANHLHMLRDAGLTPLLVTFSGLPAAVLLAAGPNGSDVSLLIDGDDRHCMLFVVGNRQILYLRSWRPPTGDVPLNDLLQCAIDHTIEAAALLLPEALTLSTIYLTPRSTRHYSIENLSGNACPTTVFDLHQSAPVRLTDSPPDNTCQGALALGLYETLSEKGFNLYRSTFPLKHVVQQYRNHFIRTGALAVLLTALFLFDVYLDANRAEKRSAYFEAKAEAILKSAFPETRNVVNPLQQMIVNVREMQAQNLTAASGAQVSQIDILDTISQALPNTLDIHVSQWVSGTERVQLTGTTDTFEAVNKAKELLEKTAFFDKITIVSANMDQNQGRVRFKLAIDLQNRP
jgi:general secretion pathway protein L